jgi:hypothetical protein
MFFFVSVCYHLVVKEDFNLARAIFLIWKLMFRKIYSYLLLECCSSERSALLP